jgi:hypothetical protein
MIAGRGARYDIGRLKRTFDAGKSTAFRTFYAAVKRSTRRTQLGAETRMIGRSLLSSMSICSTNNPPALLELWQVFS